jgi:2-polyprenyl-3-methyl-5-hydroxy-6-metoxy-1,4-benzoquinol methylase
MSAISWAASVAFLLSCVLAAPAQNAPGDKPSEDNAIAQRFNQLYSGTSNLFSTAPNAFLSRTVNGLKPGRALDVAMGQGRNAIFLAKQGWDVTGYDIADTGLDAARIAAEKAGLRIKTVHASHDTFDFGREQWDLIVMAYTLADMENTAFLRRLKESLKPGGIVVLEQMNAGGTGKGPANALFRSFQDLRVIHYEDTVDTAEWGLQKMRIGRIVAQKD